MKTYLQIFISTALFVLIFYKENIGLNLGILGCFFAIFNFLKNRKKPHTKRYCLLFVACLLSSFAFAYYGDFVSFLALFSSTILFRMQEKARNLNSWWSFPLVVLNGITFLCRFFQFGRWLPFNFQKTPQKIQKLVATVFIPLFFFCLFFIVYALASDLLASLLTDYELNLDWWQFFVITCLGFFVAFNFWNFSVERFILKKNHLLKNEFAASDINVKSTFSLLDLNSERMSGVMTFLVLNFLLLIFIFIFNYEQFFKTNLSPMTLSEETHTRVNVVIVSIAMAIAMVLFYFKSAFNFDPKAKLLRVLVYIWIALNFVLVCSAFAKNSEYIYHHGFTYKRLGVDAFLLLCVFGLAFTLIKVRLKKTNAYLFNAMFWCFYGTILACSFVNWGGFITRENIKMSNFSVKYHLHDINFSEKVLMNDAELRHNDALKAKIKEKIHKQEQEREGTWLSHILFYESLR